MIHAYRVAARVAVLGEQAVETLQAVRPAVPHDVPLAAQLLVAFQTREVLHVPRAAFRFRALVGQDDLRTTVTNDFSARRSFTPMKKCFLPTGCSSSPNCHRNLRSTILKNCIDFGHILMTHVQRLLGRNTNCFQNYYSTFWPN